MQVSCYIHVHLHCFNFCILLDKTIEEVRGTLLSTYPPVVVEEYEHIGTTVATVIDRFDLDLTTATDTAKAAQPIAATSELVPPSVVPTTLTKNQKTIKILVKIKSIHSAVQQMKRRNYYLKYLNYITSSKMKTQFSMIFEHNPSAKDYIVHASLNLKAAQRMTKMANLRGHKVYLLVPYVKNNQKFYCVGLQRKNSNGTMLKYSIDMEPEEADQFYKTFPQFNYQLVSERYVAIGNRIFVTLGYVQSPSPIVSVRRYRDLTNSSLMETISEDERIGYRLQDISSYFKDGKAYYSILLTFDNSVFSGKYKRVLRSSKKIKETLTTFASQGLYPSVISPINPKAFYLMSFTTST